MMALMTKANRALKARGPYLMAASLAIPGIQPWAPRPVAPPGTLR